MAEFIFLLLCVCPNINLKQTGLKLHYTYSTYRFDAEKFLGKLRNKRLVFVGDSLNRNQWASMLCLIDTGAPELHTSINSSRSLTTFKIHVNITERFQNTTEFCPYYVRVSYA